MIVLYEKTLKTEVLPFKNGIDILYQLIGCRTIDNATGIDDLMDNSIDMWVDDEGLIDGRYPVFIFTDQKGNPTGQIVGNIVFQTSDVQGESHGLTLEQVESLIDWFKLHQVAEFDTGILYGNKPTNEYCRSYVIRDWETVKHRQRIADMKEIANRNGWFVIDV